MAQTLQNYYDGKVDTVTTLHSNAFYCDSMSIIKIRKTRKLVGHTHICEQCILYNAIFWGVFKLIKAQECWKMEKNILRM